MYSAFGVDHGDYVISKMKIGAMPQDPGMRAAGWARQLTSDSAALKASGKTKKQAVKAKKWGDLLAKPENGLKWDLGANYGRGTAPVPGAKGDARAANSGVGVISGKKKNFAAAAAAPQNKSLGQKTSDAWSKSKTWMGQHKLATGGIAAGGAGTGAYGYSQMRRR